MIERDMKGQAEWILLNAICPVLDFEKKVQHDVKNWAVGDICKCFWTH